ncbi:hypothetical protein NCAS_0A04900 [Naumovozyma castellii]|uniref:Bromo domain-containing protein n=1 Tax=Naumovozyma castellii TaxID=27288 RepID=G0V6F6_NAUCA|nr:hypothetical protein NCAS_0A04900 [Naumovozyma castellii CBS 4309]CCC67048.1 hypothetical protein NCAS_0A04900 [Naumovozyma castellii CBS 4309]
MPPRKRKITNDETENVGATVDDTQPTPRKYLPGKRPRHLDDVESVDYLKPLDPESELFQNNAEWTIPKFNTFVNYALDTLSETYKDIFKDFIKLPSRKFHPQYYYKIENPISINEIKSRDYETDKEEGIRNFLLDVELLAKNCDSFNEPDSLIVKNAFQTVLFIKFEVLRAKNAKRNFLINEDIRSRLLKHLQKLMDATEKQIDKALGEPFKDSDNTVKLSDPFMELVDRDTLPEYYEAIHKPMALNIIKTNLESGVYVRLYDFIIDVDLVFQNALIFNDPSSLIYQDAKKLSKYFNHLIETQIFTELEDAKERGELTLTIESGDYENYLTTLETPADLMNTEGQSSDNEENAATNDGHKVEVEDDYDFNHFESLGNGYTKTLLTEDYLLNPKGRLQKEQSLPKRQSIVDVKEEGETPIVPKYNILKSLQNDQVSEQYTVEKKPYKMIRELSLYASKGFYDHSVHPTPGTRPSTQENWFEYTFLGDKLSQNENSYSFQLDPQQVFLSVRAMLNSSNWETSLIVNKEQVKAVNSTSAITPTSYLNPQSPPQSTNGVKKEEDTGPEKYEFKLAEGLNALEYTCYDTAGGAKEVFKFWINSLP